MKISWLVPTIKGFVFATLFLSLALLMKAQPATDSPEINKILAEVKSHSILAVDDSAELESYTRMSVSWQLHARRLTTIKEHVNNLIGDYKKLDSIKGEGSPWQQEAIGRIDPLLREMATHLNATIEHLNDNQDKIRMKPYQDYVRANHELIQKAHQTISDFVEYSQSKSKAESFEKSLNLPDSGSTGN